MTEREYRVRISSPYGNQPVEQFRHFLGKVADEAGDRWGIDIDVQRVEDEPEQEAEFQ